MVIAGLIFVVLGAAIYFPILRRRVKRAARLQQQSEEQARRELAQPITVNPGDPRVKTKLYWASDAIDSTLVPVTVELPLAGLGLAGQYRIPRIQLLQPVEELGCGRQELRDQAGIVSAARTLPDQCDRFGR